MKKATMSTESCITSLAKRPSIMFHGADAGLTYRFDNLPDHGFAWMNVACKHFAVILHHYTHSSDTYSDSIPADGYVRWHRVASRNFDTVLCAKNYVIAELLWRIAIKSLLQASVLHLGVCHGSITKLSCMLFPHVSQYTQHSSNAWGVTNRTIIIRLRSAWSHLSFISIPSHILKWRYWILTHQCKRRWSLIITLTAVKWCSHPRRAYFWISPNTKTFS